MHPFRARLCEGFRHIEWIDVVIHLPAIVALLEADDSPAAQIDTGKNFQCHSRASVAECAGAGKCSVGRAALFGYLPAPLAASRKGRVDPGAKPQAANPTK